ncbi:hypothetical protein ACIA58_28080 [Kribbella sp. NPDC051586]|uniref:hypothetical protein n=1 Tax=Kribbella sp. NPDC051586 TaxID=3364118 RepID=UPI0037AF8C5A
MDGLLRRWGLQGYDVRALAVGTNNAGYYVGDEFVLRIHRNPVALKGKDFIHTDLAPVLPLSAG